MPAPPATAYRAIATQNEGPLHAALKSWYAQSGDRIEVPLEGRQIDLVRGELLIEIQTGSLSALKRKLTALLENHPVRVVYPLPVQKWIVRIETADDGEVEVLGRRKSPKRGRLEDAFDELVGVAKYLDHPRFSLDVLLTAEEEVRTRAPGRAWRRKGWVIVERRLIDVLESHAFACAADYRRLIPQDLAPFTTADLAGRLRIPRALAQKMAYCLRTSQVLHIVGKDRNAHIYTLSPG